MAGKKVLIVATNHDKLGDTGTDTGSWLEEIASPYYVFKQAGAEVTVASLKGGAIPLDPASMSGDFFTTDAKKFKEDAEAWGALQASVPLSDVSDASRYDAVFVPGGHGVVYDAPGSAELIRLLEAFASAPGKIVASVCHGPAALAGVKGPDGRPLVHGKKVTGFTNSEEEAVGKTQAVPFLLEDKLKQLGGLFECAADWCEHVVRDGCLVTGQNPQSSAGVAKEVLAALGA